MKRILVFLLLLPVLLLAGPNDTLYVLRVAPDSVNANRQVLMVFLPDYITRPGAGTKIDVYCQPLIWNADSVRYDTAAAAWRLLGVDTAKHKIVYTTEDTLPAGGIEGLILGVDGRFTRD
ncbi:MAG: hypothetical protein AB1599_10945 [Planctomycetota bacterium]